MKIEQVKISELKPAKYNPRQLKKDQFAALRESLDKFGFVDPVVVNKKGNVIVGGHQRVKVWQDLGNEMVPVFWVDLDPAEEKELNIRLNSNTGEWDFDVLGNFFEPEELEGWGFDMNLLDLDTEPPEKKKKEITEVFKIEVYCVTEEQRLECIKLLESKKYDAKAL